MDIVNVELRTVAQNNKYTIGKLYIDGKYYCDTIEDTVRDLPEKCPYTVKGQVCKCKEKVYAKTAIPAGIYEIKMTYSNKFKRILPLLMDVPHFIGIRIHRGNTEVDSAGCIIIGENKVKGKVINSTQYEVDIVKKFNEYVQEGKKILITITRM